MPSKGKAQKKGSAKERTKRGPSSNPWILHVKEYSRKNPNKKWSECLKEAKETYKKNGVEIAYASLELDRRQLHRSPKGGKIDANTNTRAWITEHDRHLSDEEKKAIQKRTM